jgi:hypothetical protein
MCSDSEASPERGAGPRQRRSLGASASPERMPRAGGGSALRAAMAGLRGSLEATAAATFGRLRGGVDMDMDGGAGGGTGPARHRQNALLWSRTNSVLRFGITSLYTHAEISAVVVSLIRDSAAGLATAHGVVAGLCQELVFSSLAKHVLRAMAADFIGVVRNAAVYATPTRARDNSSGAGGGGGSGGGTGTGGRLRAAPSRIAPSRALPTSASGIFSSPKNSSNISGADPLSYLDLKKSFHFVHNYFVLQNEPFFGSDVVLEDGSLLNPMKKTATAYFSFLRMCMSFIIEVMEPTVSSKVYLTGMVEDSGRAGGGGGGGGADPSLLLGGRLLHEIMTLSKGTCICVLCGVCALVFCQF